MRNLGMNMRAERSTLEGVKAKLAASKREKQADLTPDQAAAAFRADFDERLKQQEAEARRERQVQRQAEKERKNAFNGASASPGEGEVVAEEIDPMAAQMGFAGFGTTKQKR